MIDLDGCFSKTKFMGELLVALGKDPDEKNFPIEWVVVKNESTSLVMVPLNLLKEELDLGDGSNYTLISNMHKVCNKVLVALIINYLSIQSIYSFKFVL